MSFSFVLSGFSSVLSINFNSPIYLKHDEDYEIGLINFDSFYSFPNIDESNNSLLRWDGGGLEHQITAPTAAYEITDLINIIQQQTLLVDDETVLIILRKNRTNSIGYVIGFYMIVEADNNVIGRGLFSLVIGNNPVRILKVNAICID